MLSYLAIRLMQAGHLYTLIIGFAVVAVLLALILAVIGSTFPAMFPTHVRYGAFAIGYNVSTSVFGGTAGVVTEFLINHTGDKNWPAYYLMIAAAVAVVPIWLLTRRELRRRRGLLRLRRGLTVRRTTSGRYVATRSKSRCGASFRRS